MEHARPEVSRDIRYEILGVGLLTLGILLLVSAVKGSGGFLIVGMVRTLQFLIGAGMYVVPVAMIFAGSAVVTKRDECDFLASMRSRGLLFLVLVVGLHLRVPTGSEFAMPLREEYGGIVGAIFGFLLRKAVGEIGSYIVLAGAAVVGLVLLSGVPVGDLMERIGVTVIRCASIVWKVCCAPWRRHHKTRSISTSAKEPFVPPLHFKTARSETPSSAETTIPRMKIDVAPRTAKPRARAATPGRQLDLFPPGPRLPAHYKLCLEALDPPSPSDTKETGADTEAGIKLVEETLASFRIEAKVNQVKRGPVVTRYEVQPAPGIRVNRITNLADDLALALAAIDVRVEAPVPGKSVIGIEVPNKRIALVRLREIIELAEFVSAPSKLTFALGKDIAGHPMFADLARMPHLLIAGATNSGKSVCLNSIITSILSRATPDEVKVSLIDPKRVELTLYKDVPHLFHPVVVDAQGAMRALRGSIREMERRYKLFAEKGVRNITSYNSRLDEDEQPLYYIVIVIDELADLMMQAAAEFERLICRIAQLARATGIHLIIATQRPSVNVITGVIKANISSRIAFAVASQVDSRTILDVNGAERLIGQGDMLFHPIDAPKPVRIQGAFMSEDEVNRVVDILVQTSKPIEGYALDLDTVEEERETRFKTEERDELFYEALKLIRQKGQASASMLQREFEIGYPRAGRIIDQLEQAGYISAQDGSKPREVLMSNLLDKKESDSEESFSEEVLEVTRV